MESIEYSALGSVEVFTHSWVGDYTWCLHLDDLLYELDAAYSDSGRSSVPSLQYIRLDRGHLVPDWHIMRVCNTEQKKG